MALQRRLVQAALGKQVAKGTPATTGDYRFGLTGGRVMNTEITEGDLNTTWSTRLIEGFERTEVRTSAELNAIATKALIGQLLVAACGGHTVTGSGPYTHTIVEAEPLNYYTIFGREQDLYVAVHDAQCSRLELTFDRTQALRANSTWMGTDAVVLGTPWTATTDERVQTGYYNMGGGAFTIDGASANIQRGTITIDNHHAPIPAAFQVTPIDVMAAQLTIEMSFTVIPDDLGIWRKVVFGTALGTAGISPVPYYGAVHQVWKSGTDTLTFDTPEVAFMAAFPEANPEGGPVELEITAKTAVNLAGQAFTWTLINEAATY
jgi:hypothetical protein